MAEYINRPVDQLSFRARSPFGMFGIEYFLALIFGILSYTSVSLTTFSFVTLYHQKGNIAPTVDEVWGYFKFYFFRVMGSSLLILLGLMVAFVFCIVPGVWLWPAFSLIIPIMIAENTSLGYAFNRGFQLVKGNYWTILGVLIISVIVVYVIIMVFVVPISLITTGTMVATGQKLKATYLVLVSVATHICYAFFMLPYVAMAICYYSFTEQKDGVGMLDRINNIGNTDDTNSQLPSEEY